MNLLDRACARDCCTCLCELEFRCPPGSSGPAPRSSRWPTISTLRDPPALFASSFSEPRFRPLASYHLTNFDPQGRLTTTRPDSPYSPRLHLTLFYQVPQFEVAGLTAPWRLHRLWMMSMVRLRANGRPPSIAYAALTAILVDMAQEEDFDQEQRLINEGRSRLERGEGPVQR
jgi:hypothetical protein